MSIIEAAGLSAEEAQVLAAWACCATDSWLDHSVVRRFAALVAEELEAARPIEKGDRIGLPWPPFEQFTVQAIHDGWAFCFSDDDSPPTVLRVDAVERVR